MTLFHPYTLIAIAAAIVLVFGGGYVKGVKSEAKETAACKADLLAITTTQLELEKKSHEARLVYERQAKDSADAWSAAVDYFRSNPRIIRVQPKAADSKGGNLPVPESPDRVAETTGIPQVDSSRTLTLTEAEVNERLAVMEKDVAQLAHLIAWHEGKK